MMDGEDVYRARLTDCLAAAAASPLPQVREKHLAAARSWQALLDSTMERKAHVAALQAATLPKSDNERPKETGSMSDTPFDVPDVVADAIDSGTPSVKAFRQSSGQSQHDVAANAGMTDERLAAIEQGSTPHGLELAVLSDVLDVPVGLLVDE